MTTQPADPTPTPVETKPQDPLAAYVRSRAAALQGGYTRDEAAAVATLARMRRALPSGEVIPPDCWDAFAAMPEALMGRGDQPSPEEWAAVTSLSLFSLHVQSRRERPMHVAGWEHSPGRAFGRLTLAAGPGAERRFRALTRAPDHVSTLAHLRGLVTMLRGQGIPLDYGRLATDLRDYQLPGRVHVVRMRWIRDFHRPARTTEETATTTGPSTTDLSGDPQ